MHQNTNITSFKKLRKYQEIPSTKFPIDCNSYEMINSSISLFQGGSGRYREYLFREIINLFQKFQCCVPI